MRSILGRVSTLQRSKSGLVGTSTSHTVTIFEHIDAFAQVVEEEVGCGIFHLDIITKSIAPTIA